jgi:hypothetical protein
MPLARHGLGDVRTGQLKGFGARPAGVGQQLGGKPATSASKVARPLLGAFR